MNLQDILLPVRDLLYWTFDLLEMANDNFNMVLELVICAALLYWTFKLFGYQKDEVPNR